MGSMEDHRRLTVVLVRAKVDGRRRTGVKQKRGVLSSEPLNCTFAKDGAIDLLAPFHPSPPLLGTWLESIRSFTSVSDASIPSFPKCCCKPPYGRS